jgi:hypothetical protein
MEKNITPIETEYKGYKFRSRLEARWAVFFDRCSIKYIYEPEGFELSNGERYLPDFYLPDQDAYFEVKSIGAINISFENNEVIFEDGREKASKYFTFMFDAVHAGHTVIIVEGDPADAMTTYEHGGRGKSHVFTMAECLKCGRKHLSRWPFLGILGDKIALACSPEGLEFVPCNTDYFCLLITKQKPDGKIEDIEYVNVDEQSSMAGFINMKSGMLAARQARFEYGEAGGNKYAK